MLVLSFAFSESRSIRSGIVKLWANTPAGQSSAQATASAIVIFLCMELPLLFMGVDLHLDGPQLAAGDVQAPEHLPLGFFAFRTAPFFRSIPRAPADRGDERRGDRPPRQRLRGAHVRSVRLQPDVPDAPGVPDHPLRKSFRRIHASKRVAQVVMHGAPLC